MENLTKVGLNCFFSFVSIFVVAKMLGKKQVAQLTVVDYVVGITIGNIAGQWCIDYRTDWYLYLVAIISFLIFTLFVNFLERKVPFKKFLKGKQLELVTNGKINYKNLKKSKLDINDILGLARAKGYFDINQISYMFLENNGEISVLPNEAFSGVVKSDIMDDCRKKNEPAKYVIIDGRINKTMLQVLNKDEEWLWRMCKINSKKDLSRIILAEYDGKKMNIHFK